MDKSNRRENKATEGDGRSFLRAHEAAVPGSGTRSRLLTQVIEVRDGQ